MRGLGALAIMTAQSLAAVPLRQVANECGGLPHVAFESLGSAPRLDHQLSRRVEWWLNRVWPAPPRPGSSELVARAAEIERRFGSHASERLLAVILDTARDSGRPIGIVTRERAALILVTLSDGSRLLDRRLGMLVVKQPESPAHWEILFMELFSISGALWYHRVPDDTQLPGARAALCAVREFAPINIRLKIKGDSDEPPLVASLLTALEVRDSAWGAKTSSTFLRSWPIAGEADSIEAGLPAMRAAARAFTLPIE